jgi:hypothetical protein
MLSLRYVVVSVEPTHYNQEVAVNRDINQALEDSLK